MIHGNALLTPLGRLQLARVRVVEGWSIRQTADRFQVSTTTVVRWSKRYQQVLRSGGMPTARDMADRPSRPHRSPNRTHPKLERRIVHKRVKKRIGPVELAARVGLPPSTVHAVLTRRGLNRLADLDQATGAKIRRPAVRYERDTAGELVHVDIKKVARIPDGGVQRLPCGKRLRGKPRRQRRPGEPVDGKRGYLFLHTAVDDHSRLAYVEALPDETATTAAAFWRRAQAFYAGHGLTVREVLTDNGPCYTAKAWAAQLADAGIKHRRTLPYRPQTNGKVERFHRTLVHGWVHAKPWNSDTARLAALDSWLRTYKHHRPHTALGRRPPISRIPTATAA